MFDLYKTKGLDFAISFIDTTYNRQKTIAIPKSNYKCKNKPISIDICPHLQTIVDEISGDTICTECGLVVDSKLIQKNPPRIYDNRDSVKNHYEPDVRAPRKKYFYDSDLSRMNQSKRRTFERAVKIGNYLTSSERRDTQIYNIMKKITSLCHFSDRIFETAYKHYQNLIPFNVLQGHESTIVCATLLHISANECDYPVQLEFVADKSNQINDVTPSDMYKIRKWIAGVGYEYYDHNLTTEDILKICIRGLSNLCVEKSTLIKLHTYVLTFIRKTRNRLRYCGNIPSFVPSIVYLIGKKMGINVSCKFLANHVSYSHVTIETKAKKILNMMKKE